MEPQQWGRKPQRSIQGDRSVEDLGDRAAHASDFWALRQQCDRNGTVGK